MWLLIQRHQRKKLGNMIAQPRVSRRAAVQLCSSLRHGLTKTKRVVSQVMLSRPGSFLQKQNGFDTLAGKKKTNKHLCLTLLSPCAFSAPKKAKMCKLLPPSEDLNCLKGVQGQSDFNLQSSENDPCFPPPLPLCSAFSETGNYLVRLAKWPPCTAPQDIAHDDDGD